jgi:hypothetical protein
MHRQPAPPRRRSVALRPGAADGRLGRHVALAEPQDLPRGTRQLPQRQQLNGLGRAVLESPLRRTASSPTRGRATTSRRIAAQRIVGPRRPRRAAERQRALESLRSAFGVSVTRPRLGTSRGYLGTSRGYAGTTPSGERSAAFGTKRELPVRRPTIKMIRPVDPPHRTKRLSRRSDRFPFFRERTGR